MTDTEPEQGSGGRWAHASDGELACAMRPDADDNAFHGAWREFDRRHLPALVEFVAKRARGASADVRDDLVSEVLHRIEVGIARYVDRGAGTLRSWCVRIAGRTIDDFWRGRLKFDRETGPGDRHVVSFDEVEARYCEGLADDPSDLAESISTADSATESRPLSLREQIVREAFRQLNDVDQAVIWYTVVHDEPDREIATWINKPVDHVRKVRHKAIKKLRRRFEQLMAARQAS